MYISLQKSTTATMTYRRRLSISTSSSSPWSSQRLKSSQLLMNSKWWKSRHLLFNFKLVPTKFQKMQFQTHRRLLTPASTTTTTTTLHLRLRESSNILNLLNQILRQVQILLSIKMHWNRWTKCVTTFHTYYTFLSLFSSFSRA